MGEVTLVQIILSEGRVGGGGYAGPDNPVWGEGTLVQVILTGEGPWSKSSCLGRNPGSGHPVWEGM